MSDILIKNIEMPEDCRDCPLQIYYMANGQTKCRVTGKILADFRKPIPFEGRAEECPLIEVHTPHGRLIDADAYHKEIIERYQSAREWYKGAKTDDIKARAESALFTFTECSLTIRKMPTIIEAEEKT